ncbi:MAG: fasciclin domain-containing protein [Mangrovibacterium sp.]|nr:fasciclin domain-containing protein [Mangrovibacterium sp.]
MKALIGITGILLFLACACNDDYYADGGILDENTGKLGVSTMDYLERCGADYDTLVALIKICGLESDVNAVGNTFLAPRDYSIHNYFELIFTDPDKRPASLSEINDEEMEKISGMLKNYIIPGQKILREDLSTAYSFTTTLGGKRARFNVFQEDYLGNLNKGAKYIVFSLDKSEGSDEAQYQSALVVTSDLKSVNGVVHVLDSYSHIFGFN